MGKCAKVELSANGFIEGYSNKKSNIENSSKRGYAKPKNIYHRAVEKILGKEEEDSGGYVITSSFAIQVWTSKQPKGIGKETVDKENRF